MPSLAERYKREVGPSFTFQKGHPIVRGYFINSVRNTLVPIEGNWGINGLGREKFETRPFFRSFVQILMQILRYRFSLKIDLDVVVMRSDKKIYYCYFFFFLIIFKQVESLKVEDFERDFEQVYYFQFVIFNSDDNCRYPYISITSIYYFYILYFLYFCIFVFLYIVYIYFIYIFFYFVFFFKKFSFQSSPSIIANFSLQNTYIQIFLQYLSNKYFRML